ncbi:MAG: type III pantothenate kinase [Desulfonatronovibrionaceae bacterium]
MGGIAELLVVDAGNTNLKIGLADRTGLQASFCLPTPASATADSLGLEISGLLDSSGFSRKKIKAWAVSSVVPRLDRAISGAGRRWFSCPVYFVPADIPVPVANHYKRPAEVGADRLVTAYSATRLFSSRAFIVVDFGTATTLDCIRDGKYLGGLICPGVLSSVQALGTQTAKLPQVSLEGKAEGCPDIRIGESTRESLENGLLFGFAALVQGLCARLKDIVGGGPLVVATGGLARDIAAICPEIDSVCEDLLLKGLQTIFYESFNQDLGEERT